MGLIGFVLTGIALLLWGGLAVLIGLGVARVAARTRDGIDEQPKPLHVVKSDVA